MPSAQRRAGSQLLRELCGLLVHVGVGDDAGDDVRGRGPPAAVSTRFVSVSSSARLSPTIRGRNQLDDPSGVRPTAVYAITNLVDSPAMTRSDAHDEPEAGAGRAPVHRGDHRRVAPHEHADGGVERREQCAHELG